jgi:hypothetical protein
VNFPLSTYSVFEEKNVSQKVENILARRYMSVVLVAKQSRLLSYWPSPPSFCILPGDSLSFAQAAF